MKMKMARLTDMTKCKIFTRLLKKPASTQFYEKNTKRNMTPPRFE